MSLPFIHKLHFTALQESYHEEPWILASTFRHHCNTKDWRSDFSNIEMKENRKKPQGFLPPSDVQRLCTSKFTVHKRREKSDPEVFYCEEGGGSGSVFLAKEEVLFTHFQACREQ